MNATNVAKRLVYLSLALSLCACGSETSRAGGTVGHNTPELFTGTWYGPDGAPAERGHGENHTYEVEAHPGSSHCEWEGVVFLNVGWPLGTTNGSGLPDEHRKYIRDPAGVTRSRADGELDLDAYAPNGAQDSGYGTGDVDLWFGEDGGATFAYLYTARGVERWPRVKEAVACY